MKRVLLLSMLFITVAMCGFSKTPYLRVMTFNLRFGELASLEELAELINREKPDLIALQEVDWMTERDRTPHQHHKDFITELGYRTGMFSLYGKTISHANGWYGIGLLTRRPYINVKKVMLPKADGVNEFRALLMAEIELSDNDTIVFASTHLDYSSSQARMEQVKTITKELTEVRFPVIVGGDFNATPRSIEMVQGFKRWCVCSNDQPTSPAKNPKNKIDYLFAYPQAVWRLVSSKVIETQLSDHFPIVSEVELITQKK